jgi:DMSO/TMAO reductase YedYZ heme-binding membrane subunit
MLFLIAIAAAFGFAYLCKKPLKQHPYMLYIGAAVISIIVAAVDFRNVPEFLNTYIIGLFSRGAFGTALWAVVMWTGAFPNGSKPIKAFMPIRGELSIFAAILTLGHNIGYGKTYFVRLFTDASRMSAEQLTASFLTIAMLIIMIPLTVMSFPQIRKKMNAKLWKKIQRTAYLFYGMMYLHVMVLFVPMAKAGRQGYFLSVLAYSIVFIGYAVCRIRKWYLLRKKAENIKFVNAVCVPAFAVMLMMPCLAAKSSPVKNSSIVKPAAVKIAEDEPVEDNTTAITSSEMVTSSTTAETATDTTETTVTTVTEETTEESTESVTEEETEAEEESAEEEIAEEEAPPEEEPEPEPEPVYIYNNGTYTAAAYGYDGDIEVSVTIENDVIVDITGVTYESDSWYYDSAAPHVISQILKGISKNPFD